VAGRIVVFGATGYTGRLTAEALVARGERPVLAGRDPEGLMVLSAELGGGLETAVANVARPESVASLVGPGDVLVSTVGPFLRWGEPAVEAAIARRATYFDSTGESGFIRAVFERYGPRAARVGPYAPRPHRWQHGRKRPRGVPASAIRLVARRMGVLGGPTRPTSRVWRRSFGEWVRRHPMPLRERVELP
jgi:Saccharopine dehydrogenase NADP binding domain